jgi:carboxypeptidase Q
MSSRIKKSTASKTAVFLIGILALLPSLRAQQPNAASDRISHLAADDGKIAAEIKDHSELMKNLEYLSDEIGPRLTGSANLDKASHWTEQKFKDYGLDDVHLEAWQIAHSWTRGEASGRIVSPVEHKLILASAAWCAGTQGAVTGPVVYVNASKAEDLAQYKGKLKGAYIVMRAPHDLEPPINPMLVPFGDPVVPLNQTPKNVSVPAFNGGYFRFMMAAFQFFGQEGVAGILMSSDKKYGILNMLSLGGPMYFENPMPVEILSWEDYNLIWRLMQKGPVQVELNIHNTFGEAPAEVYNTVAEIKGSERPDEVVIIAGHLDSWDLGTGATDNGTGAMAVLEAARALKASGLKPKRTIQFILFTGEEQGLVGSSKYVDAHKAELPKISAALIHDTGTGKVLSIGMMGNYQDREMMDEVLAPLHLAGGDLSLDEPSLREMGGSDHASFDRSGVPGFWVIQDPADYALTHHSQGDTFDRVDADGITQGAQVLAAWAYNVAQMPDLFPRKPVQPASAATTPAGVPPAAAPAAPPRQ